jgi:mercuric ion transport protein
MNNPERLPSETHKPITGYLWGGLAVLTCPCHLPILAVVLAGTTAGAFLGEHWVIAALALTGLFLLSVTRAAAGIQGRIMSAFAAGWMDDAGVGASGRARAA